MTKLILLIAAVMLSACADVSATQPDSTPTCYADCLRSTFPPTYPPATPTPTPSPQWVCYSQQWGGGTRTTCGWETPW